MLVQKFKFLSFDAPVLFDVIAVNIKCEARFDPSIHQCCCMDVGGWRASVDSSFLCNYEDTCDCKNRVCVSQSHYILGQVCVFFLVIIIVYVS
jgi:hypothetical protein